MIFQRVGKLCLSKAVLHRPHSQLFFFAVVSKPSTKITKNISKATSGNQQVQIEQWSKATALILSFLDNWMLYSKTGCKHDFQSWIPVSTPP